MRAVQANLQSKIISISGAGQEKSMIHLLWRGVSKHYRWNSLIRLRCLQILWRNALLGLLGLMGTDVGPF